MLPHARRGLRPSYQRHVAPVMSRWAPCVTSSTACSGQPWLSVAVSSRSTPCKEASCHKVNNSHSGLSWRTGSAIPTPRILVQYYSIMINEKGGIVHKGPSSMVPCRTVHGKGCSGQSKIASVGGDPDVVNKHLPRVLTMAGRRGRRIRQSLQGAVEREGGGDPKSGNVIEDYSTYERMPLSECHSVEVTQSTTQVKQ